MINFKLIKMINRSFMLLKIRFKILILYYNKVKMKVNHLRRNLNSNLKDLFKKKLIKFDKKFLSIKMKIDKIHW